MIKSLPTAFSVVGLTAGTDIETLTQQITEFTPAAVYLNTKSERNRLQQEPTRHGFTVFDDQTDLIRQTAADLVVVAVVGEQGIPLVTAALESGKDVALATKEVIVAAGEMVTKIARTHGRQILPLDSEHSAIWQCLRAGNKKEVAKIWLTCSGGPFRDADKWPLTKLQQATVADALKHPNWSMGQKISIDSATLMNKALELIEAVYLFDLRPEQIEVVIHPESKLHSAVEFCDGSIIAQVGTPDMRTPIAYALGYPERPALPFPKFSFFEEKWSFTRVDEARFPSIGFAKKALQQHKEAELNRANEHAVADYLAHKISFGEIFTRLKKVVE